MIDIYHIMLISLFPTPFDHFHFHPTLGLDPALILTLRLMKDASLSSDYHPGSVESDRESVAGKRGDRLTAPLLNCTLLSIAKHIRLYSLLFLSASVYCRVDGGVYSVHSKEPLSMSSQLDGT